MASTLAHSVKTHCLGQMVRSEALITSLDALLLQPFSSELNSRHRTDQWILRIFGYQRNGVESCNMQKSSLQQQQSPAQTWVMRNLHHRWGHRRNLCEEARTKSSSTGSQTIVSPARAVSIVRYVAKFSLPYGRPVQNLGNVFRRSDESSFLIKNKNKLFGLSAA